jgi:hypothetical protein
LGIEYISTSSSLCNFLHYPVTSSLLDPNTLLNTLSLLSSLNVSDQVSHPYRTIFYHHLKTQLTLISNLTIFYFLNLGNMFRL